MSDYDVVHYDGKTFGMERRHNLKLAREAYFRFCGLGYRAALFNAEAQGKPKPLMKNSYLCCQWYERQGSKRQAFRKSYGWTADADCADTRMVDSCADCLRFKNGSCFAAIDFYLKEAKGMSAVQSARWIAANCSEALQKEYSRILSMSKAWSDARLTLPSCEWMDKKGRWSLASSPADLMDQLKKGSKP